MLVTCTCGATCRIPSLPKGRIRCGKCKHSFTPSELAKAVPEAPPARYELENEDDGPFEDDDQDEEDY